VAMADDVSCRNTRETSMSKHQDKLEQKSLAKSEIRKDRGALDDQDLANVTGGDKGVPKVFPRETVTFSYARIEFKY